MLKKMRVHSAHHVPWTALFADRCGTFLGQKIPADSQFEIRARSSKSSHVVIDRYESTVRAKTERAMTDKGAQPKLSSLMRAEGGLIDIALTPLSRSFLIFLSILNTLSHRTIYTVCTNRIIL
jgi:hypothetical protein